MKEILKQKELALHPELKFSGLVAESFKAAISDASLNSLEVDVLFEVAKMSFVTCPFLCVHLLYSHKPGLTVDKVGIRVSWDIGFAKGMGGTSKEKRSAFLKQ